MLTSTAERDWLDTMQRMRAERDDYRKRAAILHKASIEYNRRKRWLEALECKSSAQYLRREAALRHSEAMRIKKQWGFK